jgi:hypothetical protein
MGRDRTDRACCAHGGRVLDAVRLPCGETLSRLRPAAYLETHSALNEPLLASSLSWPAAGITCLILGLVVNLRWSVLIGLFSVPAMVWISLLYRNWPIGIRVDGSAISVGAIGSARAARRAPTVFHQSRGLFTCPWSAVAGVRVVTDRAELQQMKHSPLYHTFTDQYGGRRVSGGSRISHCNIGVLISPFMRAALVIDVHPAEVIVARIRPARLYTNGHDGHFSYLVEPRLSPTWIVPTRHPEAPSEALKAIPGHRGSVRPR